MYGDPSMVFQGNNEYMYGAGGRPMSPPPGDEEALPSNENLPTALEEALAYKEHRVRELGHFGEVSEAPKTGEKGNNFYFTHQLTLLLPASFL